MQEPGAAPAPAAAPAPKPPTEDDALDDSKFDEFMGSDAGAFAAFGEYDQVRCFCRTEPDFNYGLHAAMYVALILHEAALPLIVMQGGSLAMCADEQHCTVADARFS